MLRNYILIAIRNLQRNLTFSFINIFGLSVGLACSMLIFFWVADEFAYNRFHANYDNLYKVYKHYRFADGIGTSSTMPYPAAEAVKAKSSQIKHVAMTLWPEGYLLTNGEKKFNQIGLGVTEDFLKMFSFKMIKGNAETALNDPTSIVLTETTAKLLFGDEDPINKTLTIDSQRELKVTGVIQDVPKQSTLQFDHLLPFAYLESSQNFIQRSRNSWYNNSFQVYVQLQPNADVASVNASIKDIIKDNNAEAGSTALFLYSISQWRLYSDFKDGKPSGGLIEYVRMFTIIAIFILVIACINFMNLATARSESRAREVGIRKSVGSRRRQLIFQFLGESLVITTLAFITGVVLVELALPAYNTLVGKSISIQYTNPTMWGIAFTIIFATGIFSGSYPALYLSGFKPVSVLKGKINIGKHGTTPRKVLVTAQFAFSIFLIIGTVVMYKQIMHLKDRDIGYDRENLLLIWTNNELEENFDVLREELNQTGVVSAVSKSNSPITRVFASNEPSWQGKDPENKITFTTIATEYDYTKTMGIQVLEGRDFSREIKSDSVAALINESALAETGFKNPIGEKINVNGFDFTIIGVMENVIMDSPDQPVAPLIMIFDPTWSSTISVRLHANQNTDAALARIEDVFKKNNPSNPFEYRFADTEFARKFSSVSMIGNLAGVFAALAIVITCLGLFGLAAFTAEQRTKEMSIRKVMGASVSSLVLLISKDFSRLVFFAFLISAPIAWLMFSNFLERYAYRIEITWWLLPAAGLFALLLALAIVSVQALKAALTNPAHTLRND